MLWPGMPFPFDVRMHQDYIISIHNTFSFRMKNLKKLCTMYNSHVVMRLHYLCFVDFHMAIMLISEINIFLGLSSDYVPIL